MLGTSPARGLLLKRLVVPLLSGLLALPASGTIALRWEPMPLAAGAIGAAIALSPQDAAARASTSGGYSRPSASYSRRPSIGMPSARPSAPSSGGYTRAPPNLFGAQRRPPIAAPSPGDVAISRQRSDQALRNYRQQQESQGAAGGPAPGAGGSGGGIRVPRADGRWATGRNNWYAQRGWTPPPYVYGTPSRFGIWDALFLWFLLDTLTRPGHAQFFHNNQNDPSYQQWRAEADRRAQTDPELRAKLDQLDRQLAEQQGQPRDPNYIPPDTPPEVAVAPDAQAASASPFLPGVGVTIIVIGGGVLFLLWLWRRRTHGPARPQGASGTGPLRRGLDIVRGHFAGSPGRASPFRLGATLTIDPTPFVLAANTKVPPPVSGADRYVSVQAVGTLRDGVTLNRLYLDEGKFFQLHLGSDGAPDECRYFGRIDQIIPANENEWGFWLDPREGVIGWPEFQTKDGKTYQRAWSPGETRIPPYRFTETRQDLSGTRTVTLDAMLYAAPTGAAPPAPATEYILVSAVEDAGQAWVDIHAGIDVNPSALSLS
jgi:hypothetical protein